MGKEIFLIVNSKQYRESGR